MTVSTLQVTGTRGEVTPLMHSRVDTDFYQAAFARARNVMVTRYGPVTRVPGTLAQGRPKLNGSKARLIPFEFNAEQVYEIEVGHEYMRFWTPAGQVFSGGSPYEIASPFTEDDLPFLHGRQSGDALYLFSNGRRKVYVLRRNAETDWAISAYTTEDGPFMPANTTGTSLTPAARGSAVPIMTSNTTPSGTVASNTGSGNAYSVFNGTPTPYEANTSSGWVSYTFASGTKVVDAYWLQSESSGTQAIRTPTAWRFEGYDGSNWITLDSRMGESGWGAGETRFYEFQNTTGYEAYRFIWTGTGDTNNGYSSIGELGLHERAESQTPFNLTASSVTGINGGAGFQPVDAGRLLRFMGSDGQWRWFEIMAYVSPTVVEVRMHGHALPDLAPSANWRLGLFRGDDGPFTGTFFEDRLVLAGHVTDPIGMWMSVSSDYDNFTTSQPLVDDDGLSLRLTGGKLDAIKWLEETGQLLAGTSSSLRSVGARGDSKGVTHDNVKQRAETLVGAGDAQPIVVENTALFIDRNGRRVYEASYSYEADGFVAREVTTLGSHLFSSPAKQIVFFDDPHKTAVIRREDGLVVMLAYDKEQRVVGMSLADFKGEVEDVSVLNTPAGQELWMVVRRPRGSDYDRFIEKLAPFYDDDHDDMPIYAACAYTYTGAPTTGLTGLDALRGRTVGIWCAGRDIGDAVVDEDGELELPLGDLLLTDIVVGERMPWRIQTLRLNQHGQQDGSGLGRHVRIVNARLDLYQSAGVSYTTPQGTDDLRYEGDVENDPDQPEPLLTGMVKLPVDDCFSCDGVLTLEGSKMYPMTLRAIALEVEGEP